MNVESLFGTDEDRNKFCPCQLPLVDDDAIFIGTSRNLFSPSQKVPELNF